MLKCELRKEEFVRVAATKQQVVGQRAVVLLSALEVSGDLYS